MRKHGMINGKMTYIERFWGKTSEEAKKKFKKKYDKNYVYVTCSWDYTHKGTLWGEDPFHGPKRNTNKPYLIIFKKRER